MRPQNIKQILYMDKQDGRMLTFAQFKEKYHFEPEGVNFYYRINPLNESYWRTRGKALHPERHRDQLNWVLASLNSPAISRKRLDMLLEPPRPGDYNSPAPPPNFAPFRYVAQMTWNTTWLHKLAEELQDYVNRAQQMGKVLDIVIRYGSEMNDVLKMDRIGDRDYLRWGEISRPNHIDGYKRTFRQIREIFRRRAPGIKFTFSPALRRDLLDNYNQIATYWPGDQVVDVISCTWYCGDDLDLDGAIDIMRRYYLHRQGRHLPFGIDEMGGVDTVHRIVHGQAMTIYEHNDVFLEAMFDALGDLRRQSIRFDYVSIFLESKWGTDATLQFLVTE